MPSDAIGPPFDSLMERVRALYATEHGAVGGCLHIVLDDGNLEDENVEFCIGWAEDHGCTICRPLAIDLLAVDQATRQRIYENVY